MRRKISGGFFVGFWWFFFFCVYVCSRYSICNGFNCRFCSLLFMKQVKEGEPEELMPSWFVLGGLVLISREQALPNTVVLGCSVGLCVFGGLFVCFS